MSQQPNPVLLKTALAMHEIHAAPAGTALAIAREMMLLPLSYIDDPDLFRVCVTEGAKILRQTLPTEPQAFNFSIGDRTYHVRRDAKRGDAWVIVANGDLIHSVSTKHYGDVGAFQLVGNILQDIEARWAEAQGAQPVAGVGKWAPV